MMTYRRWWFMVALSIQAFGLVWARSGYAQERTPRFLIATKVGFAPLDVERTPALMRRISPSLNGVPVPQALVAISEESGVAFVFAWQDLPAGKRVRLRAEEITVAAALTEVLLGAGMDVVYRDGRILLVKRSAASLVAPQANGTITGRVTERGTNVPVPAAQVMTPGVASRYTDDKGQYRIPNVPAGEHVITVKRVGFEAASRLIRLNDGETVMADFVVGRVPTMLTEMVTTATGERSRLEIGNAIGTIKADSLVPTTLIRNMSDLLQARMPGVVVTNEMGRVGEPSKIRIRGITSAQLNNDPIIVLDGVRLNWLTTGSGPAGNNGSQTNTGSRSLFSYNAPSRLDDIDPNTIESIDVLRGPSAATLYGTEAANGVIVIKTKKGTVGSWRLNLLADAGESFLVGRFPDRWYGWGHTPAGALSISQNGSCGQQNFQTGALRGLGFFCQLDSIVAYNGENDPNLTSLGTGTAKNLSVTLSGGSEQLQEFLSFRTSDQVGLEKMPAVEQRRVTQAWGEAVPSWLVRPNAEQDLDGSSRTNIRVGSKMDMQLSAHGVYRNVRSVNGDAAMFSGGAPYLGPWDTLANLAAEGMRRKQTGLFKRGFVSTSANYVPTSWLTFNATLGGDYTLRTDESTQRSTECTVILGPATGCATQHSNDRSETFITTMNVGAQLSFTPRPWLTLRTSVGEQYSGTTFYELLAGNGSSTNLAFGTDLITPSPVATSGTPQLYTVTESRDQAATAGFYVEQTAAFRDRLFLTLALRQDAASAFGPSINQKLPTYPKFSASWLVSDEAFFPFKSVITNFRLRLAYGHSGNQAQQTDVLPNYQISTVVQDNISVPGIVLSQIPNPILRPERVQETEGGFDLSFLENERMRVEATLYRKLSSDAIISAPTAGSLGAIVANQRLNLGSVENRGIELAFTTKLVESHTWSWGAGLNYTANRNTLISINSVGALQVGQAQGYFFIGQPLYVRTFARPGSWYDLNGDGVLQPGEVAPEVGIGNATIFLGAPYPKSEITYNTDMTFFSGMLRVSAHADQVNDIYVSSGGAWPQCVAAPRTCTLEQQALELSGQDQLVSTFRLSELSATYTVPSAIARRILRVSSAAVTFAGRNLALWTNYRWQDPTGGDFTCNGGGGCDARQQGDAGRTFGQPVNWTIRLNVGF